MAPEQHPRLKSPNLSTFRRGIAGVLMSVVTIGFALPLLALRGCEKTQSAATGNTLAVNVGGKTYTLDLALDDPTRVKGLGGRTVIDPKGGMLFGFKESMRREFVMRDCVVPIDIIFLDAAGRIVAMHAMVPDAPRKPTESDRDYEVRLIRYDSKFSSQFVIELAGGEMKNLNLKTGDRIEFDHEGLKKRIK
jgi:uncharacterized membrane protein (UPF0127 family)